MKSAVSFIKKDPIIAAVLAVIILAASFFRLWDLANNFHFLGDQGRDALVVSRIFTDADLVFIGPVTSVGNMYLGPFYYYFMLPFLFMTYPSPVGPVYAVALLNIITVIMLFVWGKEMVGKWAALIGAGLLATSHVAISLSRFSWNPNIAPFFSLLLMYSCFKAWKGNYKWWIWAGVAFSVLLQLHYITILAGGAAGILWLIQLYQQRKNGKALRSLLVSAGIALIILVLSLTPLFLFDAKHKGANATAFESLLTDDENFVQNSNGLENVVKVIKETHGRSMHVLFEFSIGENRTLNTWLVVAVLFVLVFSVLKMNSKDDLEKRRGVVTLILFLSVGILGLSFYEHNVYDHYIAYLFPATFLVLGFCLAQLLRIKVLGWLIVIGAIILYEQYNVPKISYEPGGPSQSELRSAAHTIHEHLEANEPYSIVLLSESGDLYGMNYRYFLSTQKDKRPLSPEQLDQAKKLVIINEDKKSDKPQDLPIYEIVVFGHREPSEVFTLENGIEVSVLSKEASDSE